MTLPEDRSHLLTEQRNPRSRKLDKLDVAGCVELILREDAEVLRAVDRARPALVAFLQDATPRFRNGGRLVYVGAGTSGRLGVLDASEMPPTYNVPPDRVIGLIAGGAAALTRSSEGKEDDLRGAVPELEALALTEADTVLGIAAGGTTPFARGALEWCAGLSRPPLRGFLVCTPIERPPFVDHLIVCDTGPEVVTGSTRMKAGTATKLVLNNISTTLMVQSGKVHENLMVDVAATNEKLRDRAARILVEVTGVERDVAFQLLDDAAGEVRTAIVMHGAGVDADAARARLEAAGGRLRSACPGL